jgi:hypothetical protein
MWDAHGRHVLVLTSAGKPVFTRHGSDGDAARVTSIITALLARAAEGGDALRSLSLADGTAVVFAPVGQVILVCVVRRPEEPEAATRAMLATLHGFLALTLTGAVLDRVAERARGGGDVQGACQSAGRRTADCWKMKQRGPIQDDPCSGYQERSHQYHAA